MRRPQQNTPISLLFCLRHFMLLPSDAFKVTAGLHLASHLSPAFPWGILSSALLGPVLYCPHSSSQGKCLARHNSFSVMLQVSDAFVQLFSPLTTCLPDNRAHSTRKHWHGQHQTCANLQLSSIDEWRDFGHFFPLRTLSNSDDEHSKST